MGGLLKNIYSQDRSLIIQALKKKKPRLKLLGLCSSIAFNLKKFMGVFQGLHKSFVFFQGRLHNFHQICKGVCVTKWAKNHGSVVYSLEALLTYIYVGE